MKVVKAFSIAALIFLVAVTGLVFLNPTQPYFSIKPQSESGSYESQDASQEIRILANVPASREEKIAYLQREADIRRKNQARNLVKKTFAKLQEQVSPDDLFVLCDQYLATFLIPNWIKDNDLSEKEFGIDLKVIQTGVRKEKAETFFRALVGVLDGTWKKPKKSKGYCYQGEGSYFRPDDLYDVALEIMDLKEDVPPEVFERHGITDERIRELLKKGAIADVARWRKGEEDDWRHSPQYRIYWAITKGWATIEELELTEDEVKKLVKEE